MSTQMSSSASPLPPSEVSASSEFLAPSVVLPGYVKKRKSLISSNTVPISDEPAALELFDKLIADGHTPESTFLTLMQRYDINVNVLQSIGVKKLKYSFSKAKYRDIAPLFGLDPTDTTLSQIPEFEMHRAWLPATVVKSICQDVDVADVQYGQMVTHNNEEARSRYIASIFNRIVYLFHRKVTNRPEEFLEGEITNRGRIEHHFVVFGSVSVLFIEVKRELLTGKARQDQVAQVMAEADACDRRNASNSLWVPILGILCDGEKFQFFVFDSNSREFSMSRRFAGLQQDDSDIKFLGSIKKTAEYMYDFFLAGYINGLRAFLDKSTKEATHQSRTRRSTGKWDAALKHAEVALSCARSATGLALQGKIEEGEGLARNAIEYLTQSVEEAPERPREIPSIMDAWNELEVIKASS